MAIIETFIASFFIALIFLFGAKCDLYDASIESGTPMGIS